MKEFFNLYKGAVTKMKRIEMEFGKEKVNFEMDENNILQIINPNPYKITKSEEEIVDDALAYPIASPRLRELVHEKEKVCIVVPDVTRVWQKPSLYLYKIVQELKDGGVKDENIIFISALGTHRKQTKEEHALILGEELAKRFDVIDHDCFDKDNLVYVGKTTYDTPVFLNKAALECDHIIITGAIVYHFLAGWSGGRKTILPGIAAYETIMANHALSLNAKFGEGTNPLVCSANIVNNPVHEDMLQAASFVHPTFMFNVVMDPNGNFAGAVAGNYIEAHTAGRELVNKIDGVSISEKADLVIASTGGYPKDINLYQSIKTLINSEAAVKEKGTIIIISECEEGLGGDKDVQDIILNYDNMADREKNLREAYTISKYVGYYFCLTAEKYNIIMVSKINPNLLKTTKIKVVTSIDEAFKLAYEKLPKNATVNIMPHAGNTLPRINIL